MQLQRYDSKYIEAYNALFKSPMNNYIKTKETVAKKAPFKSKEKPTKKSLIKETNDQVESTQNLFF